MLYLKELDLEPGAFERVTQAAAAEKRHVFDISIAEPASPHHARHEAIGRRRRHHHDAARLHDSIQLATQGRRVRVVFDGLEDRHRIERVRRRPQPVQAADRHLEAQLLSSV